jgi:phasin family protein
MFAVPEDVSSIQKAQLDTLVKFVDATADAAEQWFELNLKSAKAANAEVVKQIRALASVKDVQELSTLQTSFSQANAEKAAGFVRALYGWATETQGEMSKLVEDQIADINRTLSAVVDRAAKSAPNGSEFAFAAVKSALTAGNQAYDAFSKAGKQVADLTEATVNATTQGVAPGSTRKKAA